MAHTNPYSVPIKDRFNNRELSFPRLSLPLSEAPSPSILSSKDVPAGKTYRQRKKEEQRVSRANRKLSNVLGAGSEYRRVRFNRSYEPILNVLGEDLPLHPEYLYVFDIITSYYGLQFSDLLEYTAYAMQHKTEPYSYAASKNNTSDVIACLRMVIYFLYVQYKVNPTVIMQIFGIDVVYLRMSLDNFVRDYGKSQAVKTDYATLVGRLMELEP